MANKGENHQGLRLNLNIERVPQDVMDSLNATLQLQWIQAATLDSEPSARKH